jgi:pimeloyl-ACP methyl ester carboxylesterase
MSLVGTQMTDSAYHSTESIDLPDGNVCFLRKGSGAPVILLHGAPVSLLTWRHNVEPLAAGLDVIAPDLKGFGRSSKQQGSYSLDAHVRFLLQLMDKLGLPQASFVGSSYGCAIALTLASMHPERVDRLVLINSVGYPGGRHSLERLLRIRVLRKVLEPTLRSPLFGRRIFASGLRRSYADRNLATAELIDSYFQLLRSESGERTFLSTLEEFDEARLAAIIPSIPHQTLIIWGAKDHILPVSNARRFEKEMQCSHLEVLSECGHFPHEENPDRTNSLILQFLQGRDSLAGEVGTGRPSAVGRA